MTVYKSYQHYCSRMEFTRRLLVGVAVLVTALSTAAGVASAAPAEQQAVAAPEFGPSVKVFDPSMPTSEIQATVDSVANQQVDNEMGTQRYALLFKPGTYGSAANPLVFQVGYYTEVAGLGASPNDVTINGHVDVYNRCLTPSNCIALVNFWRSLSNLTINVMGLSGCRGSGDFWAVSQAAPMRRVNITGGNLTLMDYCTAGPQYASGGFIADSTTGFVINGSQQQFLVRDSSNGGWSNAVWNQVFAGVRGAPAQSFPNPPYTTLATTPVSRERPYLYVDSSGAFNVFVPATRTNSSGPTWQNGQAPGRAVPLRVGDVKGADIAGLMIDAGPVNSPMLLQVGTPEGDDVQDSEPDPADPTVLHDVFFRVGGPHVGKATVSLEVNSDHVIIDDLWAWRADHGVPGSVGWTVNTADTGVVVNGDDVTALGLFVEHYQKYNVIWNGQHGKTIFFQNELPYDPPNQAAYQHDGVLGWAAYKVADSVQSHELWGGGSYVFFNVDPTIHATRGFEVPVTPGVQMHDLLTVNLSAGTIDHVVNDTGAPATTAAIGVPSTVVSYP